MITHCDSIEQAKQIRDERGGWIFVPDPGVHGIFIPPIWFDVTHTPTQVIMHRATVGYSGKLI